MNTKKKTVTLSINDDPSMVLCKGHVSAGEFNQAFQNEGWSDPGDYRQKDLCHTYVRETKHGYNFKKMGRIDLKGMIPVTVTTWDSGYPTSYFEDK